MNNVEETNTQAVGHDTRHAMDIELLLDTAQLAALTVLESGGETSRAEEIATIICRSCGEKAEAIAFPTGIFITVENEEGHKLTSVARVRSRNVNLYKVERANAYSRSFSSGNMTLEELNSSLNNLRKSILYSKLFSSLAIGLSAAAFALLFEEKLGLTVIFDMAVAFMASVTSHIIATSKRMKGSYHFTSTFLSSVLMTALSILFVSVCGIGDLNCILIGSIMPLLPGLSLTNAIRDTVMGDSVSGTVRAVETLLTAVALAGGVGIALAAYVSFFGGAV